MLFVYSSYLSHAAEYKSVQSEQFLVPFLQFVFSRYFQPQEQRMKWIFINMAAIGMTYRTAPFVPAKFSGCVLPQARLEFFWELGSQRVKKV